MTPLQENKLMNAILKAVVKGKGKKAIAIAAKKDRKLGMKVKDMVQSILGLQSDLQKIRKSNPVVGFSKRVSVKLGTPITTVITPNDEIQQTVGGVLHTGRVFKTGGPLATGANKLTIISSGCDEDESR